MAPSQAVLSAKDKLSAGYGRSCTNCSRAKCKCILNPGAEVCERCSRLEKECVPMTSSRRKSNKKPSSSRTAQLEEKLDDLVSILRASQGGAHQQQQPQQPQQPQQHLQQQQQQSSTVLSYHRPDSQSDCPPSQGSQSSSQAQPHGNAFQKPPKSAGHYSAVNSPSSRLDSLAIAAASSSAQAKSTQAYDDSHMGFQDLSAAGRTPILGQASSALLPTDKLPEPTPDEAEVYYAKFKTWMKFFPFLSLPPDQTADQLRKERPFTWLCIMNITSMSIPQIGILKERVKEEAGKRIVIDSEKNLDLLQGLVLYVAWSSVVSAPNNANKHFLIVFAQLAASIMYDLGLARSPLEGQFYTGSFKVLGPQVGHMKMRTTEERRTLLALWYMTSVLASFFGKMDTLRWSTHLEECLDVLSQDPELPSDEILCNIVKAQLIADETNQLLMRDAMGDAPTPTHLFKKGLLHRLQEIRESISPSALSSLMVRAQILSTEVMIHSVGLYHRDLPSSQRVQGMYQSLKAVQAWYDVFFSVPLDQLIGIPLVLFVQLSQTHVTLYKLTTADEPAWNKELVRNEANLLVLLDQTVERLTQAGASYTFRAEPDQETLFGKGARMMNSVKASWEPVLSHHLYGLPTPNSHSLTPSNMQLDSNHALMSHQQANHESQAALVDPSSMELNDLAWMFDIFGPWDF